MSCDYITTSKFIYGSSTAYDDIVNLLSKMRISLVKFSLNHLNNLKIRVHLWSTSRETVITQIFNSNQKLSDVSGFCRVWRSNGKFCTDKWVAILIYLPDRFRVAIEITSRTSIGRNRNSSSRHQNDPKSYIDTSNASLTAASLHCTDKFCTPTMDSNI